MGLDTESGRAIAALSSGVARAACLAEYEARCVYLGRDRLSELRRAVSLVAGALVSLERELSLAVELAQRQDIGPPEL
jgi:hypothetical protein